MGEEIIFLFLMITSAILSIFFVIPWLFGAPFEGSKRKSVERIIEFSRVRPGERVVELGSGDGRIAIAFAKKGAMVEGFEINPFLVLLSRMKIRKLGLENKVKIHWKSFWKADLSEYDIIALFQFRTIMRRLEKKIKREAKPKVRIVSNTWKFPTLKLKRQLGGIRLYGVR